MPSPTVGRSISTRSAGTLSGSFRAAEGQSAAAEAVCAQTGVGKFEIVARMSPRSGRHPGPGYRSCAAHPGDPLLERIEPPLLLSSAENWPVQDAVDIDLKILLKQNL
jgi:hypothetical protein